MQKTYIHIHTKLVISYGDQTNLRKNTNMRAFAITNSEGQAELTCIHTTHQHFKINIK